MSYSVLVTDPIANDGLALLQPHAKVDVRIGLKGQELLDAIRDYDALIVRSETRVTAEVIKAGVKLQVIGRAGVGVDNIDVDAATERGIVVVYAPTGNTVSAAELTIGLMLALARNIPQGHAFLREGQWRRNELVGTEVRNKSLGVVGLGRVGLGGGVETALRVGDRDPAARGERALGDTAPRVHREVLRAPHLP